MVLHHEQVPQPQTHPEKIRKHLPIQNLKEWKDNENICSMWARCYQKNMVSYQQIRSSGHMSHIYQLRCYIDRIFLHHLLWKFHGQNQEFLNRRQTLWIQKQYCIIKAGLPHLWKKQKATKNKPVYEMIILLKATPAYLTKTPWLFIFQYRTLWFIPYAWRSFWKLTLSRLAPSKNCKYHSFCKHLFTKIFIPMDGSWKRTWNVSYHQVTATSIKWKTAFHQCFVLTQMLQFKGILSQACIQRAAEFLDYFIHCFWAGSVWCYLGDCSHYPRFSFRSNKSLLQQAVQLC